MFVKKANYMSKLVEGRISLFVIDDCELVKTSQIYDRIVRGNVFESFANLCPNCCPG